MTMNPQFRMNQQKSSHYILLGGIFLGILFVVAQNWIQVADLSTSYSWAAVAVAIAIQSFWEQQTRTEVCITADSFGMKIQIEKAGLGVSVEETFHSWESLSFYHLRKTEDAPSGILNFKLDNGQNLKFESGDVDALHTFLHAQLPLSKKANWWRRWLFLVGL